jgi:hypothetical protein
MEASIDGTSLCNVCTFFSIDQLENRAHRRNKQEGTESPMSTKCLKMPSYPPKKVTT